MRDVDHNDAQAIGQPIPLPRALLFDMDGTLTEPMLDFDLIKREMGIPDKPILETLATMACAERAAAEAVLHRHEERAALDSTLNRGCENLLDWVRATRLGTALITRNSRLSVERVLARHGMTFDVLITREDVDGKFKPHPGPLLEACERLRVRPAQTWMIGDSHYDVRAGLAAGARTVWISHGSERDFPEQPWRTVRDLPELLALLIGCATGSPTADEGV
jgi:HAD superfamily hydrolase (TIGR01509 family)